MWKLFRIRSPEIAVVPANVTEPKPKLRARRCDPIAARIVKGVRVRERAGPSETLLLGRLVDFMALGLLLATTKHVDLRANVVDGRRLFS